VAREVGAVFFRTGVVLRSLYSGDDVIVGMGGLGLARTTYIHTYIHTYAYSYVCVCVYVRACV
jgi:hypothetical protein